MMDTNVKDKLKDRGPKENLREPDGEENNLLFTDEYKEALEKVTLKLLEQETIDGETDLQCLNKPVPEPVK